MRFSRDNASSEISLKNPLDIPFLGTYYLSKISRIGKKGIPSGGISIYL
jgi:hypothetical protein